MKTAKRYEVRAQDDIILYESDELNDCYDYEQTLTCWNKIVAVLTDGSEVVIVSKAFTA